MKKGIVPLLVGAITIIAGMFGLSTLMAATLHAPSGATAPVVLTDTNSNASSTAPKQSLRPYPTRLLIPSLGINAHVQYVGLTAAGAIGAPSNFTDVAWFVRSALPGQRDVTFFDGHVDNGLGLAGVFKYLANIKKGAAINIVTKNQKTLHFIVTSSVAYNYLNVPMAALLNSKIPTIRLMTCDGIWVNGQRTYNERLVVTAVLKA